MTNDYMFRMVLQKNNETLVLLLSSILHIPKESIVKAEVQNPITPGDTLQDKEYQLDVVVELNDNTIINLEMQVVDYKNWPERSLSYLCRKFDNVARGRDYIDVKPVYHIGFLDFTLFKDHPEFFAKYHLRNDVDGFLFTNKFHLYVVELNHTELATDEDRRYNIDIWAKLFKATTWEEIHMIIDKNPSMNTTAEAIFINNADAEIAEQCRIREDAIIHERVTNERLAAQEARIDCLTKENNLLEEENSRLKDLLAKNGIKAED